MESCRSDLNLARSHLRTAQLIASVWITCRSTRTNSTCPAQLKRLRRPLPLKHNWEMEKIKMDQEFPVQEGWQHLSERMNLIFQINPSCFTCFPSVNNADKREEIITIIKPNNGRWDPSLFHQPDYRRPQKPKPLFCMNIEGDSSGLYYLKLLLSVFFHWMSNCWMLSFMPLKCESSQVCGKQKKRAPRRITGHICIVQGSN